MFQEVIAEPEAGGFPDHLFELVELAAQLGLERLEPSDNLLISTKGVERIDGERTCRPGHWREAVFGERRLVDPGDEPLVRGRGLDPDIGHESLPFETPSGRRCV